MTGTTELETLKSELLAQIAAAKDLGQLEAVRVAALGKKGRIAEHCRPTSARPSAPPTMP